MFRVSGLVTTLVLMTNFAFAQDVVDAADAQSPPNFRLTGEAVTTEAMSRLAGRDWNEVTLAETKFDGKILESLRYASSIRTLRLFGTNLSGQIPRLERVKGLIGLEIGTPLRGLDYEAIGQLTQLERLNLWGGIHQEPTINVAGAIEIARLTRLKALGLYHVNIDDASFAELWTLEQLEELDLTHTRLTDEGLRTLEHMPKLRKLELHRHWMTKQQLSDTCIPFVCRLDQLEHLSLSGKITNDSVASIAALPKLTSLSLIGTNVDQLGLVALGHSSIERLTITANQVNAEFDGENSPIYSLRKCHSLKHILVIGESTIEFDLDRWKRALPDVSVSFSS